MDRRRVVLLCDPNRRFMNELAKVLARYFCSKGPTNILVFDEKDEMQKYAKRYPVDLVLINEMFYEGPILYCGEVQEILLKVTDVPVIQAEKFINRDEGIINISKEITSMGVVRKFRKASIISVYSVLGCRVQSSFAYFLSRRLAQSGRVLYISFTQNREPGSLLASPGAQEFVELLKYMDTNPLLFRNKLHRMMCRQGNMYYLSPGIAYQSLLLAGGDRWIRFVEYIKSGREFTYIILELTDFMRDSLKVLSKSDVVYMVEPVPGIGPEHVKYREYSGMLGEKVQVLPNKLRFSMVHEVVEYVRSVAIGVSG